MKVRFLLEEEDDVQGRPEGGRKKDELAAAREGKETSVTQTQPWGRDVGGKIGRRLKGGASRKENSLSRGPHGGGGAQGGARVEGLLTRR